MTRDSARRGLLVASTGGHLEQLARLRRRLVPRMSEVEWVTFDTQQARHTLHGEVVHFVPMIRPKDLAATIQAWSPAGRLIRDGDFDAVVTTGAAIALPFLFQARRHSVSAHYIESAARSLGPSLTGSIVRRMPSIHLYTQYPVWADHRWNFSGAVFDGFRPGPSVTERPIDRVVVTLGTQEGFGFERAIVAVAKLLPQVCTASPTVLWQTGATDVTELGIVASLTVPAADLRQAVREADLVIGHAGVGTALMTLEAGRRPVLLPRRRQHREHTDDHQLQIVAELGRRGLSVGRDPDVLSADDLVEASLSSVVAVPNPPDFTINL